ncbi:unnamed protein product [Linum trigynum]|uniref:Transposase-associated domain-containing protein n=1 Tax=Linum trigynum TaxID=586398 RepID=A0AAV2FMP7_9ROSI
MDRSWLKLKDRFCPQYVCGVDAFIQCAMQCLDGQGRVRCPCRWCNNCSFKTIELVKVDIYNHGMVPDYVRWVHHGEPAVEIGSSGPASSPPHLEEEDNFFVDTNIPTMLDD